MKSMQVSIVGSTVVFVLLSHLLVLAFHFYPVWQGTQLLFFNTNNGLVTGHCWQVVVPLTTKGVVISHCVKFVVEVWLNRINKYSSQVIFPKIQFCASRLVMFPFLVTSIMTWTVSDVTLLVVLDMLLVVVEELSVNGAVPFTNCWVVSFT